jgi:hypothetical protein
VYVEDDAPLITVRAERIHPSTKRSRVEKKYPPTVVEDTVQSESRLMLYGLPSHILRTVCRAQKQTYWHID